MVLAAAAGGAVVLILLIVIIVVVRRRRRSGFIMSLFYNLCSTLTATLSNVQMVTVKQLRSKIQCTRRVAPKHPLLQYETFVLIYAKISAHHHQGQLIYNNADYGSGAGAGNDLYGKHSPLNDAKVMINCHR